MHIHDYQMYHGAALIQIAEHERFTAINSLKVGGKLVRGAYLINTDIAISVKYASKPTKAFHEYLFQFTQSNLKELSAISKTNPKTFIALVCEKARGICCISFNELQSLIVRREKEKGSSESLYTILVTAGQGKSFRVYINAPGVKGTMLGKAFVVSRNGFPGLIFA